MIYKTKIARITEFFLTILILVNSILLAWYCIEGYKAFFHSDSAVKVLLAIEMLQSGELFPKTWNYINGDILLLFGHIFSYFSIPIFGQGFSSHAVASLLLSTLIVAGQVLLCNAHQLNRISTLTITAITTAGISGFMAENLFGQGSYGAILCITIYLLLFFKKYQDTFSLKYAAAALIIYILATWSNPMRALITYAAPFALTILITQFKAKGKIYALLTIFAATALGYLLHKLTLLHTQNTINVSAPLWLAPEHMLRNFLLTWKGILSIFGAMPPENMPVASIYGLYFFVKLVAAITLLILIRKVIYREASRRTKNFIVIFGATSFALTSFIMLCTTLPDMSDPIQSSRYLIPSLYILSVAAILYGLSNGGTYTKLTAACIAAVYALSAPVSYILSDSNSKPFYNSKEYRNQRLGLIKFLEANNLHYGYGGYWNSGAVSILSAGNVRVRQILLPNGVPQPWRYLSSNTWYEPEAWKGDTFMLLTPEEAKLVNWIEMAKLGVEPIESLEFNEMKIYKFTGNIANQLPGWRHKQ